MRLQATAQTAFILIPLLAFSLASCRQQASSLGGSQAGDALFPVAQGGMWGYIDASGDVVIQPHFNRAHEFSEGVALVETDNGFGYVLPDGRYAVEPQFEDGWHFSGGVAPVQEEGVWRLIDRDGRIIADPQDDFRPAAAVDEDYQPREFQLMHSGGLYGFRSESGDVIIEPRFEQAWYFSDGLARVKLSGRWGFIDAEGRMVIEPEFDLAWDFTRGLALVMMDGKYGYIDRSGDYVWRPSE